MPGATHMRNAFNMEKTFFSSFLSLVNLFSVYNSLQ